MQTFFGNFFFFSSLIFSNEAKRQKRNKINRFFKYKFSETVDVDKRSAKREKKTEANKTFRRTVWIDKTDIVGMHACKLEIH